MKASRAIGALLLLATASAAGGPVLKNDVLAAPNVTVSVVAIDLLWIYLGFSPRSISQAEQSMAQACSRGFTFLRVAGTPFYPVQMNDTYLKAEPAYWEQYDALVAAAGAAGCTIMPSLFWSDWMMADLYGEPAGDVFRSSASKARAAMLQYATKLVTRYASNPVVAAWEIGNEWSLNADINMNGTTYGCATGMGTPAVRTFADNRSTDDVISLSSDIAAAIRAADPSARPISSGHALPRPSAEHLRRSYTAPRQDWTPDSLAEFTTNLAHVSAYADWASVHVYAGADMVRWGLTHDPQSAALLQWVQAAAAAAGKALYVGEFGDPLPGPRPFSVSVLDALQSFRIRLATAWVWEFYQFSPTAPANYSLVPGRDDSIVAAMQAVNAVAAAA